MVHVSKGQCFYLIAKTSKLVEAVLQDLLFVGILSDFSGKGGCVVELSVYLFDSGILLAFFKVVFKET